MIYPIDDLLDEKKCYDHLNLNFHDGHLVCPICEGERYHAHKTLGNGLKQLQCDDCSTYFNMFTGTCFEGTHWPCSKVVMVLRGFAKGETTLKMSKEMGLGYRNLLYLRHEVMSNAMDNWTNDLLPDVATESDEMYQNSGEKGIPHPDPEDPPRRRANKKKGMGLGRTTPLLSSAR